MKVEESRVDHRTRISQVTENILGIWVEQFREICCNALSD